MTSFFSAEAGLIWIKFWRQVQNDMSTAVMLSKSKPDVDVADVWANSMACHSRATCHIVGCCHLANSMSWSQRYVSHCRVLPPGEFNGIPEPRITLQSAATWYIPLTDFYQIWHGGGSPMYAPLRQILPFRLRKCGLTAQKSAENAIFCINFPQRGISLKRFLQNFAWGGSPRTGPSCETWPL